MSHNQIRFDALYSPNLVEGGFSEVRMRDPAYPRSDRLRNAPDGTPSIGPAATGVCALDGYAVRWMVEGRRSPFGG